MNGLENVLLWLFGILFFLCIGGAVAFFAWIGYQIVKAANDAFKWW